MVGVAAGSDASTARLSVDADTKARAAAAVLGGKPVALENRIRQLPCRSSERQAARTYSLIRPLRTGFRRICRMSTLVTLAGSVSRSSAGVRWAMPWCGRAML